MSLRRVALLAILAILVDWAPHIPPFPSDVHGAGAQSATGKNPVAIRPATNTQNSLKVDTSTTPNRVEIGCEVDQQGGTTVNGIRITGAATGLSPTISAIGCANGGDASPTLSLASVTLGGGDSATPASQNLSGQNTLAGTSNTAGGNLNLNGGKGTGTGAGGSVIIQVAPASQTSGTTQNPLAAAVTITGAASPASTFGAAAVPSGAGQTNIAGGNTTLAAGQGTGSGIGGNVLVQVAYPGVSGTSNNALGTVATINGTNNAASGTTALVQVAPTINGSGTNGFIGLDVNVTETAQGSTAGQLLALRVGGTTRFAVTDGLATVGTQMRTAQATAPTCTTNCGTPGNTVTGTDTAGLITMGTTPASGFVVVFNGTWASAPACTVTPALAGMVTGKKPIVVATTPTQFTVTTDGTAPATSDLYNYVCVGKS